MTRILKNSVAPLATILLLACDAGDSTEPNGARANTEPVSTAAAAGNTAPGGEDSANRQHGHITAVIDGTERTWHIQPAFTSGGQWVSQSEWMAFAGLNMKNVTLFGHNSAQSRSSRDAIMVSFTLRGTPGAHAVDDPSVTLLAPDISNTYSSSHDGTATVVVERAQVQGELLSITGSFEATLPFKSLDASGQPPMNRKASLTQGTFEAAIRKAPE